MKYVLGSSVAVKWVLVEQHSDKAGRLRADFQAGLDELLAPEVFPGEVGHSLTRAERQGRITSGEAIRLWSDVMTTPPKLVASLLFTHRAILVSSQMRASVFDCLYVALAEREGCELISADDRLVNNMRPQFPFERHLSSMP
jgi:predicted nucleic acid-binding protein